MKYTFVITQTTYPCSSRLCYSSVRSMYSPKERLQQLIESIESIYEVCPQCNIIVIENGMKDIANEIPPRVEYKYFGDKPIVRWAADSLYKGLGEAVLLVFFLCGVMWSSGSILYFKLSGRYKLDKDFNFSYFDENKFNFLFYGSSVSTRLYSVPGKFVRWWMLSFLLSAPGLLRGCSIESLLPRIISKSKINELATLHIYGSVGVDGCIIRE